LSRSVWRTGTGPSAFMRNRAGGGHPGSSPSVVIHGYAQGVNRAWSSPIRAGDEDRDQWKR
jgi:hypothetical protein